MDRNVMVRGTDHDISVHQRSGADRPPCDGRAPNLGDTNTSTQPQLTVHSGCQKPCDSFVAVCYQGYWFWIDRSDFNSKRSFLYLKILLALADTGQKEAPPALTIRAN